MTNRIRPHADPDKAAEARRLAERGLHEQAIGNNDEADRLLTQAQDTDPAAVADVLREHDAARARRMQDCSRQRTVTWSGFCRGSNPGQSSPADDPKSR